MTYLIRKMTVCCGLAGTLALSAAAPSLAQVVVDPYYGGAYGYVGPYGYAGPYGAMFRPTRAMPMCRVIAAGARGTIRSDTTIPAGPISATTSAGGPVRPAVLPPIRVGKGSDSKISASVGL
jgi:hypothetical protein